MLGVYLGHAGTRITDDTYTHLFQDELNEAADLVEEGLAAIEQHRKAGGSALCRRHDYTFAKSAAIQCGITLISR